MEVNKQFTVYRNGSLEAEMSGYAAASQKAHALLAKYPEDKLQVVVTFNATPLRKDERQLDLNLGD